MKKEYIKLEDAREAVWRILNDMGISQKHNWSLVEEVDAVLDEYPVLDIEKKYLYGMGPNGQIYRAELGLFKEDSIKVQKAEGKNDLCRN